VAETEDVRALIQSLPGRTLAAKLRDLMPDIDQRIKTGVRHQEIVDALNSHGGFDQDIKLTTLRSYLFRYRQGLPAEARRRRRAAAAGEEGVTEASRGQSERVAAADAKPAQVRTIVTPGALREARDERVDLDALSKLGKATGKPGR
jgi:hypothetical protein